MLELVGQCLGDQGPQATVALTNVLVLEDAQALAQELQAHLGCAEPATGNLGPVIGTHTGPGVFGVAAYA